LGEHLNTAWVRAGFEAYNRGDFETLASYLAEDVVWHVGGDHPLSGDYRGRDAVLDYCRKAQELAGGTLQGEPLEILASDRHAGVFNHITAKRDGMTLDVVLAQALKLDDKGRWTEYWALADEQGAVDAFWEGAA
jgi:ketosteroid isomerase-like protein